MMNEPDVQYAGEIRMFAGTYAPSGWHFCDGATLPIADNQKLFSLLGTAYGGDGVENFKLPDLRGRLPVGMGQSYYRGRTGGAERVTLTVANMPPHTHPFLATSERATSNEPADAQLATIASVGPFIGLYSTDSSAQPVALNDYFLESALGPSCGPAVPHNNLMPSGVVNFIIALTGEYPLRG